MARLNEISYNKLEARYLAIAGFLILVVSLKHYKKYMKKTIFFFIGLATMLAAGGASAEGYWDELKKFHSDCSELVEGNCYSNIDCNGWTKLEDLSYCKSTITRFRAVDNRWKVSVKTYDTPCYNASCGAPLTCTTDEIAYNNKCWQKGEYCKEKYGPAGQWSDAKKDCSCQSGYDLKINGTLIYCVKSQVKPAIQPTAQTQTLTRTQILEKIQSILKMIDLLKAELAALSK